jgi:hypothetical protein
MFSMLEHSLSICISNSRTLSAKLAGKRLVLVVNFLRFFLDLVPPFEEDPEDEELPPSLDESLSCLRSCIP